MARRSWLDGVHEDCLGNPTWETKMATCDKNSVGTSCVVWRVIGIAVIVVAMMRVPAYAQWSQWGGPDQSFKVDSRGLAKKWPENGPRKLWSRKLGEGYSAILADAGRLYTMYRAGEKEIVICLNAKTGKTLWEHAYKSSPPKGHIADYGNGPNATPLLTGGRLYTIGVAGIMHCLSADTGKTLWSHDLLGEFGGNVLEYGYSSSPIEYKDTIITLVGGKGASIVALGKEDGAVAWKSLDYENSYSTPRILKIAGENQLVTFMAAEVIGADPASGTLKWRYPIVNRWRQNISLPMPAGDDMLFISSLLTGSRGLRLIKNSDRFDVEEVWTTRKIQNFFGSAVSIGDYVYTSTGRPGALFIAAVQMQSGKIAWRKRWSSRANLLFSDNSLILLDEHGNLTLAKANPDKFSVMSRCALLESPAWTPPTLVGTTLFVRDCKQIMALDLAEDGNFP